MTPKQVGRLPRLSLIVCIFLGCLFGSPDAFAQVSPPDASRLGAPIRIVFYDHVYILSQKEIADASLKTYVWDLEHVPNGFAQFEGAFTPPPQKVFKSLKSAELRSWVGNLPTGSMIKCLSKSDGRRKMSATLQASLDDFSQYCKSKGVAFVVASTVV